ncbi:retrotransposon protein [Hordeum vulgare]|nr:retrotransposon protein [Hordeum vulgare]
MAEAETLDAFSDKIGGMAACYAGLGSTLDNAAMVKKLLDSVPDRLYATVAGIEQLYVLGTMAFEEALGRFKTFEERMRRRAGLSASGRTSS